MEQCEPQIMMTKYGGVGGVWKEKSCLARKGRLQNELRFVIGRRGLYLEPVFLLSPARSHGLFSPSK